MSLRKILYQYCEDSGFKDLSCIIHFSLVNYISSHKSKNEWVYLSPEILNSFIGIGEDKITALFQYLSEHSTAVEKSFEIYCPNNEDIFCEAISQEDLEDEEYEIHCDDCDTLHTSLEITKYLLNFIGNKEQIIDELKIVNQDIANEIVILNTNEEHIDKLANIILSRLSVQQKNKEETKNGITKMLQSVKDISGLIAGISGDVADTSNSVKNIIEDFSGISTIKEFIISPSDIDTP